MNIQLPILQKNDLRAFFATDEELDALELEEFNIYQAWRDIIESPGFQALSFAMDDSKLGVLSKSFRKPFEWRISCFKINATGLLEAIYHGDYALTQNSDTLFHELALIAADGLVDVL